MKKIIFLLLVGVFFCGCAAKTNEAYEEFQKSPCACMSMEAKNV
jgi:PBP1b-binding outer membrane lipoprotein LpoB